MLGVVRLGDEHAGHCCGSSCHGGSVIQASSTVLADGLGVARDGDLFSCGDSIVGDSSYGVFVDGLPVARLFDLTHGHGCFPSVPIISASETIKIG